MLNITSLKHTLVGKKVPSKFNGEAGRYVEELLRLDGFLISKRGVDLYLHNQGIEVKTRDIDSTSPHTLGTMIINDIIQLPYNMSPMFDKFQKQFRVKTQNNVIISAEIYNFNILHIQRKIEEGYQAGRNQMIAGNTNSYIRGNYWCYWEEISPDGNSYALRFPNSRIEELERMTKSTYNTLFEEIA